MNPILYDDELLSLFTDFLKKLSTVISLQYKDFIYHVESKNFSQFIEINKKYHVFEITEKHNDIRYSINPEGREAAIIGVKQYLINKEKENDIDKIIKQLTIKNFIWNNIRSWIAITISLILVLISIYKPYYNNNSYQNTHKQSQIGTKCSKPYPPYNLIDSRIIEIISDSLKNDTAFIKEIAYKLNHNKKQL